MKRRILAVPAVFILLVLLCGFACNTNTTKRLAIASDAVSHALLDTQTAINQGVQQGVISQADATAFNGLLANVAKAGLQLDQSIRAGETAGNVSQKVNLFLDAFNQLQSQGLVGIKNPQLKLTISTIITGAESAVAVIAASVGSNQPAPAPPTK